MNIFQLLTNSDAMFWLFVFCLVFGGAVLASITAFFKGISNHFIAKEKEKTKQLQVQLAIEKERNKGRVKEPAPYASYNEAPYEAGYQQEEQPPIIMGE